MFTINLEDGREAPSKASTSIYEFGLSVCLYPIHVKTAEPIGPKFSVPQIRFTKSKLKEKILK